MIFGPPVPPAQVQTASLRITGTAPLELTGARFKAGESVVVTVRFGGKKRVKRVAASATGGFRLRFPAVALVHCGPPLDVTALGSAGSRATFSLRQLACGSGGAGAG